MANVPSHSPRELRSELGNLAPRVEHALDVAFRTCAVGPGCPPRLHDAQRYALFPGGGRLRPQLCLVAAIACGDGLPEVADAAAAAIELLHCASLVHDDLPCFDDADMRRGKPSVHKVFGEALALLVGDAFIVHSFDVIVHASSTAPARLGPLLQTLAAAAGTTRGILAGQAWESEPVAPLEEYQRAKTASLFEAAAAMGAIAAGAPPQPWRGFGEALGRAYQAVDDLNDAIGDARRIGKPTGRDAALGRPSIVRAFGVEAARARVELLLGAALAGMPRCGGENVVLAWLESLSKRLGIR
jgi:geranylgeranyl diphosphate synthase type II